MKTKKIASLAGSMLTFLMAALILLTLAGCEEDPLIDHERSLEKETAYGDYIMGQKDKIMSQTFEVTPQGTEFSAFGGMVWLKFPDGTVHVPTEFEIVILPVDHLEFEDYNMYYRGIYLQSEVPIQDLSHITIRLKYDLAPESWKKGAPGPVDNNLTIYCVSPSILDHQEINSTGDCCVDCVCKTIQGCISNCGFYLIGEN